MKASARYYGHRPDGEGNRQYRPGFDAERDEIGKDEVYRHAEQGEGDYAYRIVLSPGEELDGEELKEWTRDVMQGIEEAGGSWAGFVHDDHTEHPHVHVIAHTDDKLSVGHFEEMREDGDTSSQEMLEIRAEMQQDPMQEEQRTQAERQHESAANSARDGADDRPPGEKDKAEESQSQGV